MDPANENMPFEPEIDIFELINLGDVMEKLKLGPNGGLLYCMEFLEKNFSVVLTKLQEYQDQGCYFVFDCPGQVGYFFPSCNSSLVFRLSE